MSLNYVNAQVNFLFCKKTNILCKTKRLAIESVHQYNERKKIAAKTCYAYVFADVLEWRNRMAYFPIFTQMENRLCLVVGGGRIALRKVCVFQEFGAKVTVVAPNIIDMIKALPGVSCIERKFEPEDVNEKELVVAATGDIMLNHYISQVCRRKKVLVNAVDQIEDCDFIFPAYIKQGEVVAAFSSGGQSPVITQYLKGQAEHVVTGYLGQLAACLGALREEVKERVRTEKERKMIYQEILRMGLEQECIPDEIQLEAVIKKYERK